MVYLRAVGLFSLSVTFFRVSIADGILVIDDVQVFSLQNGYLRNNDG
jgi:hypothetical protein